MADIACFLQWEKERARFEGNFLNMRLVVGWDEQITPLQDVLISRVLDGVQEWLTCCAKAKVKESNIF